MMKMKLNGILLLYNSGADAVASNMHEHIRSFSDYSQFKVWAVNTHLGFPEALWNLEFAVTILHYSLFGWRPFYVDEAFEAYLTERTSSYKVAFFQDEYRWWPERAELLNRLNVNCVYTCIEPDYYRSTYWKYTEVPRLETYLPGYVSDEMLRRAQPLVKRDEERSIDIGYRGRRAYGYMGRGALEKHEVGERFREMAAGRGLVLDIASEEHKRIYGEDWLAFIADCRAVLGVEAGVSVFDIDNEIFPLYERFIEEHPGRSFEVDYAELLEKYDGMGIYYRTVSPRVFEAGAVRTCQIMYEGRYSGILEPMVHYIPLRKDFSNFEEVMRLYGDGELRRELTENCYRDLIASEDYSYRRFIEKFDEGLIAAGLDLTIDDGAVQRVSNLLAQSEQPLLMRFLEAQKGEYKKLFERNLILKQQCIELQQEIEHLLTKYSATKEERKGISELKLTRLGSSAPEAPARQEDALRSEREPSLVKQIEAQQADYQELSNSQTALQQQYVEIQKLLSECFDQRPVLKVRRLAYQALRIATLLGKGEFLSARVYTANVLMTYPTLYRVVGGIRRGLQAIDRRCRNVIKVARS
jgi:cell division protein FtsB